MKPVLILSCGEYPAPLSLVRAMRRVRKRRDGKPDLRFNLSCAVDRYIHNEDRRCIIAYQNELSYTPQEFVE